MVPGKRNYDKVVIPIPVDDILSHSIHIHCSSKTVFSIHKKYMVVGVNDTTYNSQYNISSYTFC